jgi:predicted kinase
MATLHLICGLPGAGKTTLAKELEKKHGALRFSADEWLWRIVGRNDEAKRQEIETIQRELADKLLLGGVDVVLESGFWKREEREYLRKHANELGARSKLYYLDVRKEELWKRLEKRNQNLPLHTFPITREELERWVEQFEPPTEDELHA